MAKIGKKKVAASVVTKSAKTKAIKPAKKTGGTQKVSVAAGKRLNLNSIGMEFILIPAGSFTMGSPKKEKGRGLAVTGRIRGGATARDEKQAKVTITRAFELGKIVVTQKQWTEVMGTTPWDEDDYDEDGDTLPRTPEGDNYPAVSVTWDDATKFCKKLTALERKSKKLSAKQKYRLPTEAEWEYACRAGTTTAYSCGDESSLGDYAWYGNNSGSEQHHEVATKKPNPWGLFDMHGNVWEWCEDWYEESLSGGNDPKGPSTGSSRVVRSGSWYDGASSCRSAGRGDYPSRRYSIYGFRIVRVLL